MPDRPLVTIATDGACPGNGTDAATGGWGWVTTDGECDSGGEPAPSTNNRMELTAVREALAAYPDCDVRIITDSKLIVDTFTRWLDGWKARGMRKGDGKPVKNADLILGIDRLLAGRAVTWQHVRGHRGHILNEAADRLATEAAARFIGAPPPVRDFICQDCFLTRPTTQLGLMNATGVTCLDCL
jgi:ribonuclease HI